MDPLDELLAAAGITIGEPRVLAERDGHRVITDPEPERLPDGHPDGILLVGGPRHHRTTRAIDSDVIQVPMPCEPINCVYDPSPERVPHFHKAEYRRTRQVDPEGRTVYEFHEG